ncbi:MAG TPA: glycosyltransferase family 4 protein [Bryobacteraceae bacterium]|nr:glycosyltransferase family 4 protein [Bryobacteraceae bacterium]
MRVVQLGAWPPPHGGVQTNMVSIRRYLREHGHSCAVINLTRHRREDADDVYYPEGASAVLKLMRRLRGDIYHLHIGGHLPTRLLALCVACSVMPGAKSVMTFHSGGYPDSPEGRSARPFSLRGIVFRRLDAIIAVNAAIKKMFHAFGVRPSRVHLILPFETPKRSEAPYPDKLGEFIGAHRPFLFTVGLLEPEYDLALQIAALGRVREKYGDAGLVIAGAGSLEGQLRKMIDAQSWGRHILLWGDMPHAVTLRAIAECDILLRTTHYDGDSIAVREALGLGTPVIASDNGMRPPGIRLIPARDEQALIDMIEVTLESAESRGQSAAGDDSNTAQVVRVYEDLLGTRAGH